MPQQGLCAHGHAVSCNPRPCLGTQCHTHGSLKERSWAGHMPISFLSSQIHNVMWFPLCSAYPGSELRGCVWAKPKSWQSTCRDKVKSRDGSHVCSSRPVS